MWDWQDYLDLAFWLADHVDDHLVSRNPGKLSPDGYSFDAEAVFRAAISRAYYAAHHCARAYVKEVAKLPIEFDNVHTLVVQAFAMKDVANRDEVAISKTLQDLRLLRNWADYETLRDPEKQADKALIEAQAVYDQIMACRAKQPTEFRVRDPSLKWPPPEKKRM